MHILSGLRRLLLASCALGASLYGNLFEYSYLLNDGLVVSGSFAGTLKGEFVENVSDISVRFNGLEAPGEFFASSFDGTGYVGSPVISFDGALNNFFFADSDLANADYNYSTLFYVLNGSDGFDAAFALSYPLEYYGSQDAPAVATNWSLASVSSVPDCGPTGLLLGGALLLLGVWRRVPASRPVPNELQ